MTTPSPTTLREGSGWVERSFWGESCANNVPLWALLSGNLESQAGKECEIMHIEWDGDFDNAPFPNMVVKGRQSWILGTCGF